MERIRYTPWGVSPKEKNHVFFAAHPEDAQAYFTALQQDVKNIEPNCIFWYDDRPAKPWDEALTQDLAQTTIQLFLFPVTIKLLREENNAIAHLLPYALKHRIPVLPILMEPVPDSLYARVFGDRQYLDKVTVDVTAIPYEEKLKKHLRNILVSRETAEQIRAAFDAYIFLSYRKKDRALAANLMQLIHRIPQMRDVAIWYDEFLVPGEDFNDNIARALAKSDLFAMAVTPNLINENNYVLEHEYPNANKADKPILALEVAQTDPVAFQETFTKLPGSIDAYIHADNGELLEQALLRAFGNLRHITLAKNGDPMHTYLMGLAYLHGIDVERDHARAVKLINEAAENACPEAMYELANLYYRGHVLPRDLEKTLYWQTEYVRCCKAQYEKVRDEKTTQDYIHALAGLGEVCQTCLAVDEAEEAYEEAIRLLAQIPHPTPKQQRQKCNMWERLGHVRHNEGDHSMACEYFSRCVGGWEQLVVEEPTPHNLRSYAGSLMHFADAITAGGNPTGALEVLEKAYEVCNRVTELSQSDATLRYQAGCYAHLGTLLYRTGRPDHALQLLDSALDTMLSLAEKTGNPHYYADVAQISLRLGEVYEAGRKHKEAANSYGIAAAIYKDNADNTGDLTMVQNLCAAYTRQAQVYVRWEKPNDAKQCLTAAEPYLRLLSEKGQSEHAPSTISKLNLLQAQVALMEKDETAAKAHFQTALDHHLALCRQSTNDELWNALHRLLIEWTEALLQQGYWRLAKRQCTANKALAQEMDEKWHLRQSNCLLRDTHLCLQHIYQQQNNPSAALAQLEESIQAAEKAAACSDHYVEGSQLAELYHTLANHYEEQKELGRVAILCQKAIDTLELADPQGKVSYVQQQLIRSYLRLATLLQKSNKFLDAAAAHDQAVVIARALAEITKDPKDILDLADCLWYRGFAETGAPEKKTAEEAIDLLQNLCKDYPGNGEYRARLDTIKQQWKHWKKRQ